METIQTSKLKKLVSYSQNDTVTSIWIQVRKIITDIIRKIIIYFLILFANSSNLFLLTFVYSLLSVSSHY